MSDDSDDLQFTYQQDDRRSTGSSGGPEVDSPAIQTGYDFSMDNVPDEIKGRDNSKYAYVVALFSLLVFVAGVLATLYILVPKGGGIPLNPIEFVFWAIDTISGILIRKLESAFAV